MVEEARIEETEHGKVAVSDGWFVLHLAEAFWQHSDRFGGRVRFEGKTRFPQVGIHLRVLEPGKPACLYHRENSQEDFVVLSGKCILVVEGQERPLHAGHFVHCPAETDHVFVGAGDGPCIVLMIGYRPPEEVICYPVCEAAAKYGASVEVETADPREAYGVIELVPRAPMWPLPGFGSDD